MDISAKTDVDTLQSLIGKVVFWIDDLEVKQGIIVDFVIDRKTVHVRIPVATGQVYYGLEPHEVYLVHEFALAALLKRFQTKVAELERVVGK